MKKSGRKLICFLMVAIMLLSLLTLSSCKKKYDEENKRLGLKQYLVPYLISGHPGSDLKEAVKLAEYLHKHKINPEQVQEEAKEEAKEEAMKEVAGQITESTTSSLAQSLYEQMKRNYDI